MATKVEVVIQMDVADGIIIGAEDTKIGGLTNAVIIKITSAEIITVADGAETIDTIVTTTMVVPASVEIGSTPIRTTTPTTNEMTVVSSTLFS